MFATFERFYVFPSGDADTYEIVVTCLYGGGYKKFIGGIEDRKTAAWICSSLNAKLKKLRTWGRRKERFCTGHVAVHGVAGDGTRDAVRGLAPQ